MRRITLIIALAVLSLSTSAAFGQTLGAVLTGSQETPPTTTPGFGNATVTFDATRANITTTITVANLGAGVSAFHIHKGAAGVAGGVVVNLIGLGGAFSNGTMTVTTPIDSATAQEMLQNPANFYVNVHTTQFGGGAVRGQLAFTSGGPVTYAAELRGTNEVPSNASTAFGSAYLTIDPNAQTISWEVNTNGIAAASASHIHRGAAGVSGPVVLNFATSPADLPNGRTKGSSTIAAQQSSSYLASDLTALASGNGSGYYVNVHSSAFPGGELRGALVQTSDFDVAVAGHVTNGIGQTFVTDARIFNPSYTATTYTLVEFLTGAPTATASTVVSLSPRSTAILDDVTGPSFLNASGSIGALRLSSVSPFAVSSRIYADLRAAGKGTLGQFVPGQPRGNALRRGVVPQLSNRTTDLTSGYRTNIGFFNPNSSSVTVRLELRDNAGTLLGQNTITLLALAQQQSGIGSYFSGVDLSNAANLTLSFDASAPVFGYGAVNDNVSADSIFVVAQLDTGVAANQN